MNIYFFFFFTQLEKKITDENVAVHLRICEYKTSIMDWQLV